MGIHIFPLEPNESFSVKAKLSNFLFEDYGYGEWFATVQMDGYYWVEQIAYNPYHAKILYGIHTFKKSNPCVGWARADNFYPFKEWELDVPKLVYRIQPALLDRHDVTMVMDLLIKEMQWTT